MPSFSNLHPYMSCVFYVYNMSLCVIGKIRLPTTLSPEGTTAIRLGGGGMSGRLYFDITANCIPELSSNCGPDRGPNGRSVNTLLCAVNAFEASPKNL